MISIFLDRYGIWFRKRAEGDSGKTGVAKVKRSEPVCVVKVRVVGRISAKKWCLSGKMRTVKAYSCPRLRSLL